MCQNYKTESGCRCGDKCVFRHTEVDSQPSKKPKERWWKGKGSVALLKNSKLMGCVFQDIAEIQVDYRGAQNSRDQSAACVSQKVRFTPQKFGEERVHRKELFRSVNTASVVLMLPNSRREHRKKPCNKNDAPAEKHGIWQNMSTSSKIRTMQRSARLLKFGHYQHHFARNPRKDNLW